MTAPADGGLLSKRSQAISSGNTGGKSGISSPWLKFPPKDRQKDKISSTVQ